MKKLIFILAIVTLGIFINSCNNDDSSSSAAKYPYNVRMTDAPGPFNAVNIDLQGVEVTDDEGHTVLLNVTNGIYNLLDFTNGVDVLIATSTLSDANVSQIRLILGSNNTVVVDNVTYPLSTPSAEQSGLKLLVNQTLLADIQNSILIDFDANKSVVFLGNGTYQLKPVLRTIVTATSGNIKGTITPVGTLATVSATSSTGVVYTSSVNTEGNYQITGLPPGTYSVTITPLSPLLPITIPNVVVEVGVTTTLAVVNY
ncbi:MAG: DUF4382 domain-containing protein [Bacteroidota bacterium]